MKDQINNKEEYEYEDEYKEEVEEENKGGTRISNNRNQSQKEVSNNSNQSGVTETGDDT